ncbi:unnamed protein product [Phyllotreta striolata]|uniref:VWFC domain-containing protein n=1 Tax=Phyllotreta striolata TaxID=444603 RepID=A0A9N9TJM6_PHYSR|nr:unnamed protein product [Phyllotreta striolata]
MNRIGFVIAAILAIFVAFSWADKDEVNCDFHAHLVYEDLGCEAVRAPGSACPVQYKCNFVAKNDTCTFRGRHVPVGESLTEDETYAACTVGCRCTSTNKFTCAILDCPEWLGVPVKFGCYRKYEVGQCCSAGQNCPTESTPPFECKVDGGIHVEGERYYPKDTCLECVCEKGFEGKHVAPFCKKHVCAAQVRHTQDVLNHCAPYYGGTIASKTALCCPDEWICPSEDDKVVPPNPDVDANSDLTCTFGTKSLKLGERIQTSFKRFYDQKTQHAECECKVPPLLICRDVPAVQANTTADAKMD